MARPEPDCCRTPDPRIARRFDAMAGEWAEGEELPEMVDVSARIADLLREATLRRPTVLELGSGSGGLSVALLEMGAARVDGIDLSPGSVELARRRAARAGFTEQASFTQGNAAEADAEPHDWVILDRVVCCFRDADRLVERAAALAHERVVISGPESRGWRGLVNRPLWLGENVVDLFTGGCRGFVHDLRRFERILAASGFEPARRRHQGLWFIGSYERA